VKRLPAGAGGLARTWAVPTTVAILLSAVAIGAVLGYRHLQAPPAGGSSLAELALARLDGQGSKRISDFRGRPLVVNFFASWCPACVTELPSFERAAHDYSGRIAFLGVNEQDDPSAGLKLAREAKLTYPLVSDTRDNRLFRLLHGTGMPTSVFLASDGGIRLTYSGELSEELLRQRLNDLAVN
jgi:thiol-disulfide isomerase/thioredoxin